MQYAYNMHDLDEEWAGLPDLATRTREELTSSRANQIAFIIIHYSICYCKE